MEKRGLSPVIATVLLILLVIAIVLLVFLWSRGFLFEQIEKFGNPIESYCERVDFDIQAIELQGANGRFNLVALNRGDVGLGGFEIKRINGGNSETMKVELGIPAGMSASVEANLIMENEIDPQRIFVYPILSGNIRGKGASGSYTCRNIERYLTYKKPNSDQI